MTDKNDSVITDQFRSRLNSLASFQPLSILLVLKQDITQETMDQLFNKITNMGGIRKTVALGIFTIDGLNPSKILSLENLEGIDVIEENQQLQALS